MVEKQKYKKRRNSIFWNSNNIFGKLLIAFDFLVFNRFLSFALISLSHKFSTISSFTSSLMAYDDTGEFLIFFSSFHFHVSVRVLQNYVCTVLFCSSPEFF